MTKASSYTPYPSQHLLNGAPLQRNQKGFRNFVQNVTPDPAPSRTEFYINNIAENAISSYEDGFVRYFDNMKKSPTAAALVSSLTIGLGLMFTAFRSHKKLIEAGVFVALLGYPVAAFVQHFPKMMDSYDTLKEGEPSKARQEFKKSFNELVYNVFHVYLKPLSLALFIVFPLINSKQTLSWIRNKLPKLDPSKKLGQFFNKIKQSLKTLEETAPIQTMDRLASRLDQWGDEFVKKTYRLFPSIKDFSEKVADDSIKQKKART